jgi:hypothetical protein
MARIVCRHGRTTDLVGIEPLAEFFDIRVEVMLVQNVIQARVACFACVVACPLPSRTV